MNSEQPQVSGLPLPQSSMPAGGYSFAAPPAPAPDLQPSLPMAMPSAAVATPQHQHPATQPLVVPVAPIVSASAADSDDSDEIDEAWISKAREIVDRTRDDPYTQSKALARLRADFLKSRYSKDVKISEDATK